MKVVSVAILSSALLAGAAPWAAAQPLLGYGAFTINREVSGSAFPGASGGVMLDVARSWASVGAQADLFVSGGYAAGRVAPFAQVNVVHRRGLRVFGMGGVGFGEQAGKMFGGGVDVWTGGRLGFRVTVQDFQSHVEGIDCALFGIDPAYCASEFHSGRPWTGHQPTVQFGVIWR